LTEEEIKKRLDEVEKRCDDLQKLILERTSRDYINKQVDTYVRDQMRRAGSARG